MGDKLRHNERKSKSPNQLIILFFNVGSYVIETDILADIAFGYELLAKEEYYE